MEIYIIMKYGQSLVNGNRKNPDCVFKGNKKQVEEYCEMLNKNSKFYLYKAEIVPFIKAES